MQTPESEVCTVRRERHRARERAALSQAAAKSSHRRHGLPEALDEEEQLLAVVYQRSLTMPGMNARWRRWKNAKALRLVIEQSAHEAAEKASVKARAASWLGSRNAPSGG